MSGHRTKMIKRALRETFGRQYTEMMDAMLRAPLRQRARMAWAVLRGKRTEEK